MGTIHHHPKLLKFDGKHVFLGGNTIHTCAAPDMSSVICLLMILFKWRLNSPLNASQWLQFLAS